jgi:hypothetical protein
MERRPLNVDPVALLAALTARDEGLVGTYVDLEDGALLRLYDPAIVGRSNDDVEQRLDDEPHRYARVPLFSREYRLLTEFVDTVEDDDLARLLDAALGGREALTTSPQGGRRTSRRSPRASSSRAAPPRGSGRGTGPPRTTPRSRRTTGRSGGTTTCRTRPGERATTARSAACGWRRATTRTGTWRWPTGCRR